MLYGTVCYVCCLCYKIPMPCHWCCFFRYIFVFLVSGLNLYIILYILKSLWVEHAIVVSLCLFLNVVFLCDRSFVSLCFQSSLLPCHTAEGGHDVSHLLYCGRLSVGKGGFLHWTCLSDLSSSCFAFRRKWQRDTRRVTQYQETFSIPSLLPSVPIIL